MGRDMGFRGQQIEDYGCEKKTLSHIRPVAENSCLRRQIVLLHEIALQQPERLRESVCKEMTPLLPSTVCLKLSDVRLIEPNRDNQNPLDAAKLGVDQYLRHPWSNSTTSGAVRGGRMGLEDQL